MQLSQGRFWHENMPGTYLFGTTSWPLQYGQVCLAGLDLSFASLLAHLCPHVALPVGVCWTVIGCSPVVAGCSRMLTVTWLSSVSPFYC
jgi:hypothetical protein